MTQAVRINNTIPADSYWIVVFTADSSFLDFMPYCMGPVRLFHRAYPWRARDERYAPASSTNEFGFQAQILFLV